MMKKRKTRDMSEGQFRRALQKYGFDVPGFGPFDVLRLPIPGAKIEVSRYRGGPTFRGQLAYLLRELAAHTTPHNTTETP